MRWLVLVVAGVALPSCGGETAGSNPPAGDPSGAGDIRTVGDTRLGDPGPGDALPGDSTAGDPSPGDGGSTITITPSTQLCAAGGRVTGTSYKGTVCLSPLGNGGPVSSNASYKWIPGPAHIVQGQ